MRDRVTIRRRVPFFVALLVALAALGGVAGANHSRFERVSAGQINGNGAFNASFRGISSDGARVFFQSDEQLVPADIDAATDVYMRSAGTTSRISAGQINGNGAFAATFEDSSSDGASAFFTTSEQLVPGDTDASLDIYKRSAGTTTRLSAGQINGNGAFNAAFQGASSDGARVFFESDEKLVPADTDAATDVYMRSAGTTTRLSAGQINGNGGAASFFRGASDDGSRVVFDTDEQLVPGDTDHSVDLYERFAGTTKRISAGQIRGNGPFDPGFDAVSTDGTQVFFRTAEKLVPGDTDAAIDEYKRAAGTTTRVSAGQINGNGPFDANFNDASADGSRVVFTTGEKLVPGDIDSSGDIYRRAAGTTTRLSAGEINGNGALSALFARASSDGTVVFFSTPERLVPADTDIAFDVYKRAAGTTTRVSAGQINGNGAFNTSFSGISANGARAFFVTSEQLVPGDGDASLDIYERAGGKTSLISQSNGAFTPFFHATSTNGSAVFFSTQETVLASDQDTQTDIYGAYVAP